jgi:hypothetical protein
LRAERAGRECFSSIYISLEDRKTKGVKIIDEIDRISAGESFGGKGNELSSENNWWRCRDLNPGHCGYEFEPG